MSIKEEFDNLLGELQTERDEINLKIHLASMEARQEFEESEKEWRHLKAKILEIADESAESSENLITKAKMIGEELKQTYNRIGKRLAE